MRTLKERIAPHPSKLKMRSTVRSMVPTVSVDRFVEFVEINSSVDRVKCSASDIGGATLELPKSVIENYFFVDLFSS